MLVCVSIFFLGKDIFPGESVFVISLSFPVVRIVKTEDIKELK
jgi:hypothetical protein